MQSMDSLKPELWTCSSNTCTKISIVNSKSNKVVTFNPRFTYPIFGESEQIFGYQDLEIILAFESKTFKPLINVKYSKKLDEDSLDGSKSPLDMLLEFFPSKDDLVIKDELQWTKSFESDSLDLPTLGELIDENGNISVYKCNIKDVKLLHQRIQIFTLFFIEGASYIDENDTNWDVYFIINNETKDILGYTTCYRFWKYGGHEEFDNLTTDYPIRSKISQFLIFPPYQNKGYGSILYTSLMNYWLTLANVKEITVEDPNEDFDYLRDVNDLKLLLKLGIQDQIEFDKKTASNSIISQKWIDKIKPTLKLESRQLIRLLEMLLLYKNAPQFRLQVKKRLFEKNYDALIELDTPSRNDKLQTAFLNIKNGYQSVIDCVTNSHQNKRKNKDDNQQNQDSKRSKNQ
ncbi:related to Histone acetyltransferase type B catalytic subunit [Saccharomycodes ludwigii]|uniref:Histone acetyltransferase type B catalytic subunit n=1 Tax=Saccharomycodes ludwigii TaxID=36035 RepID=A0A376B8J9_9ASCO|nr:hypothetical protein SCDLUD_000555 [Saccharomycodes ludwigii]KAH3902955.1 hypothetical protein SCDLUD_000555 [Saccharomycodes ludwigii]SSD61002.1 related to Histone acetyltransferase type B catalytic subunit [Saccharomycodes ludwigii]